MWLRWPRECRRLTDVVSRHSSTTPCALACAKWRRHPTGRFPTGRLPLISDGVWSAASTMSRKRLQWPKATGFGDTRRRQPAGLRVRQIIPATCNVTRVVGRADQRAGTGRPSMAQSAGFRSARQQSAHIRQTCFGIRRMAASGVLARRGVRLDSPSDGAPPGDTGTPCGEH